VGENIDQPIESPELTTNVSPLREFLGKTSKALIAAIGLLVCFFSWTLSSPLGSSPDENFHIGSIWCAEGEQLDRCDYVDYTKGDSLKRVSVPHVMDVCFIFYFDKSANCQDDPDSVKPELLANISGYPQLFYRSLNLFVSDHTQVSGLSMRLFNSLIATFLFFMAAILSTPRVRNSGIIAFSVTLIPLAIFLIPSLNPSSWAYMGLAFGWMFQLNAMLRVGDSSKRFNFRTLLNFILFLFCAAIAMGSRWDAMMFAVLSIFATYLIAKTMGDGSVNRASKFVFGAVALFGLALLFNQYRPSATPGEGVFSGSGYAPSTAVWEELNRNIYNIVRLIELPAGTLGVEWGIGWLDTQLPSIVGLIGTSIYAFFFLISVPYARRFNYLITLGLVSFTASLLFYYFWGSSYIVGEVVQPRYILPLIPLVLGLSLVSSKFVSPFNEFLRARINLIAGLLTLSHSVSLWTNLRRYTMGLEVNQGYDLANPLEWWWRWAPSPNLVFLAGSVAFGVFIFTTLRLSASVKPII
jgi:hypothetical protein